MQLVHLAYFVQFLVWRQLQGNICCLSVNTSNLSKETLLSWSLGSGWSLVVDIVEDIRPCDYWHKYGKILVHACMLNWFIHNYTHKDAVWHFHWPCTQNVNYNNEHLRIIYTSCRCSELQENPRPLRRCEYHSCFLIRNCLTIELYKSFADVVCMRRICAEYAICV